MENFVRSCDSCQRVGHSGDQKKAPLVLVPTIREVFSRLNLYTIGPFQRSSTRNVHVLTAICVASRYPEAIPIPDLQTPTVIDALLQLFSRTGFPREIQTDKGPCFRSTLMAEFANKFGIKLIHCSVYHPQTNPVERVHSTINRLFKVLCLEAGTDWEKQIPAILFALRTSFHGSFGFSPAELVFGRNLRTPITLLYENISGIEPESSEVTEYIFRLANRLKVIRDSAHEKLSALQVKRKTWYDRKAVIRTFNVGDKVLVFAPNKVRKLSVQWIGPGEIVEKVSDTNYVIQMPNKSTGKVYHVNMIKAYVQTGMSTLIRKNIIDEVGGLQTFSGYLAEDYFIAKSLKERGWNMSISSQPAWQNSGLCEIHSFQARLTRWAKLRAAMVPHTIILEPLSECMVLGAFASWAVSFLFKWDALVFYLVHILVWFLLDWILLCIVQNGSLSFNKFDFVVGWLFRECSSPYLFLHAQWHPEIRWRGRTYRLKWGGIAEELKPKVKV